jgi:hypothetical protein
MGVDYRVWLIPKQRSFRPNAGQIAALANALRESKWVPMPEAGGQRSKAFELLPGKDAPTDHKPGQSQAFPPVAIESSWVEPHMNNEFVLEWWVDDSGQAGVKFPFVIVPYPDPSQYFGIRMILGREYFYWTGENVAPFADSATHCACGDPLAYWTGFASGVPSQRIHPQCPVCGRAFDLSSISCDVLDGWTGKPRSLPGGLAFRFALQVDCHKNFPHDEETFRRFRLQDAFLDLWRIHIGVPYDIVETAD